MESVLVPAAHSLPQPHVARCCRDPGHKGHTALSGNYSSGQLSLAFLSCESCIFCPYLAVIWLLGGRPERACSRALLPGVDAFLPPQSSKGPGRPSGVDAELPGKGAKAVFPFSPQEKNSFLRCFCSWRIFLPLL